ncbi:hypothetical protein C2845_PM09G12280 [Panicum miliaceum]|uniref:Uncharacterized protein n=1 Tax=Panicum miliaceum TaxID=4540 RepID=A0A3L6S333_PANMI|nr:hypothetical protein C2845_PM09G12280 [Panicum miliaceum]
MDDEKLEEVTGRRQEAPHGDGLEEGLIAEKGKADEALPPSPAVEDFDFDPEEGAEDAPPRWFAMARFYSSHPSSKGMFEEMRAAWRLNKPIPDRNLGRNRMGHSKWECPDDEEESSEEEAEEEGRKRKRFGEWMRESPLKKFKAQHTIVPAAPKHVNRALKFTGTQLQKLQAASSAMHDNQG